VACSTVYTHRLITFVLLERKKVEEMGGRASKSYDRFRFLRGGCSVLSSPPFPFLYAASVRSPSVSVIRTVLVAQHRWCGGVHSKSWSQSTLSHPTTSTSTSTHQGTPTRHSAPPHVPPTYCTTRTVPHSPKGYLSTPPRTAPTDDTHAHHHTPKFSHATLSPLRLQLGFAVGDTTNEERLTPTLQ
jgi:hypothetical protein